MAIQTLIEKLGFLSNDKVVIFHVDDMGMSHAANMAAFKCLDFGVASCGSVMVPAPWFMEVASICKKNPHYDVGVHLTLTSEYANYRWRPLSTVDPNSGLIDEEGYMWHTFEEVVTHADPKAVEAEMRAQVQFAVDHGIDVTHVDTHMGAAFHPKCIEAYFKIAMEFQIPVFLPKLSREQLIAMGGEQYLDVVDQLSSILDQDRFPFVDNLVFGTGKATKDSVRYYSKRFDEIDLGLTHFIIHSAQLSNELQAIIETSPEVEGAARDRNQDYEAFTDPRIRDSIEKYNLKIIGYRKLREHIRDLL